MIKKVLILGASRYYQRTIEHLRRLGYFVAVIDMNPDSPGFKAADEFAVIDITDKDAALVFAQSIDVDGVIAINDFGIETAAFINSKMGLNGIQSETAEIAVNKAKMRQAWTRNGAPNPSYIITDNLEAVQSEVSDLALPVIIKPSDSHGGGSRGIKVVFSQADIAEAVEYAQSFYDDKTVLIEECVTGSEHSIEAIVQGGKATIIAISEKVKTPYPFRVDKQVLYPARLVEAERAQVERAVQLAVEGIGLSDGVAHVELAMTETGPVLFEIGARPGGGATPQLVEYTSGIDHLHLYAKIATGETINEDALQPKCHKAAIYHFFTFEHSDLSIKGIDNLDLLDDLVEVKDAEIFVHSGTTIGEVKTGKDRHGFATVVADNLDKALEITSELDTKIKCVF